MGESSRDRPDTGGFCLAVTARLCTQYRFLASSFTAMRSARGADMQEQLHIFLGDLPQAYNMIDLSVT